ncbi:AraC family transcriptional regulator [Jeotgalibaca sp. MA1X17-3]|uniref:AraC family transcriptional regulator n=1 Tax=Jeotgalibaca sp. MA1X17-3 TaxID=2908211 RepID=UPI001F46518A|nr:AraC family transcriptional regulator [Jeotgalibaca sp. MA1X17-3]UJF15275.1 AraC family transcriptional regulator [Jeotgalibaca sp. MA1X17-3]
MDKTVLTGIENESSFESFYYLTYIGDHKIKQVQEHQHDFYEFLFYMSGDVEYKVEEEIYNLFYGEIIVIPPHTTHAATIKVDKNYRRYVLWLKEEFINQILEADSTMNYIFEYMERLQTYRIKLMPKDVLSFIESFAEVMEKQLHAEFGHIIKQTSIFYDVFYRLNKLVYEKDQVNQETEEKELHVQISDYIKDHLIEDLSLDLIADHFFLSKYHISHIFKEKMSISIYKYILIRRLELGKALILSGEAVTKVHESCGFKDYVTFYRAFKKRYAMSPSVYVKENQTPMREK